MYSTSWIRILDRPTQHSYLPEKASPKQPTGHCYLPETESKTAYRTLLPTGDRESKAAHGQGQHHQHGGPGLQEGQQEEAASLGNEPYKHTVDVQPFLLNVKSDQ